jgi:DNA polymerase delta subunit 1
MEKYYRYNIKPINEINFQALSWKAIDEIKGEDDYEEKIYNIHVFGITDKSESISVIIKNFTPYYYAKVPEELQGKWTNFMTNKLKDYIKQKLYKNKDGLIKILLVEKKDINGFTNEKKFQYLQFIFNNEETFKKCKYIIEPSSSYNKQKIKILDISKNDLNFELYEANIEPFMRLCHQKNIKLSGWINIKKYKDEENEISSNQINISTKWTNLEPINRKDICNLRIASFDIECISEQAKLLKKNIFPDWAKDKDKITQIGTTFYDYVSKQCIEYMATIQANNNKKIASDTIIIEEFNSEKELLLGWINTIRKMNPEIIMGYNSNNFDWKYIYERCRLLDIEINLFKLSKLHDYPSLWIAEQKLASSARGENIFRYIDSPGIINTDLMTIIKQNFKLPGYKLNEVANEFIGDQKEDLTPQDIFQMADGNNKEIEEVVKYCMKDCTLLIKILLKKCIISNTIAMSCVCHVPYDYIEYKGQQIKVHSQLLYESRLNDYLIPTIPYKNIEEEEDEKLSGATVLDPIPGAYFEPVSGLDFASLYPSIMIANNYSYETIVKNKKYENIENIEYKTISWKENEGKENERTENVTFIQNKKGILPIILEKLWKERKQIKKDMKEVKINIKKESNIDKIKELENEYEVLDGFQLAMKVSMNSIYGFTGANFGRLPEKRIAAATTAEGRRMIRQCKSYLLENYDCDVVYGDTDSVYVKFKTEYEPQSKEHMEKIFTISEKAADKLSDLFKKPIEMEFEKVMYPFIIFSKKRYACVIYTNLNNYDYIDYKGIQVVRRDNCPFVKEKSIEIFKLLLLDKNIDKAIELARKYINDLLQGNVPIKDLIISKSLKAWGSYEFDKQFTCKECNKRWYTIIEEKGKEKKKYAVSYWNQYNPKKNLNDNLILFKQELHYCFECKDNTEFKSNEANIPHVALARIMEKRDKYNCPQVGERVPYVFKKTTNKKDTQFQKVEDPNYLIQNKIEIDYEYYWEHQFKSAVETIFDPILKDNLNEKLYNGIFEEKKKVKRKVKS